MYDLDGLVYRIAQKARASGPLPPAVPADQLGRAERDLGFSLPPLLRALYTQVSDGGFGPGTDVAIPGYNVGVLLPLASVVAEYQENRIYDPEMPFGPWPEGAVTMLHWGDFGEAVVDCRSPIGTVFLYESDVDEVNPSEAWKIDAHSLVEWWEAWLAGIRNGC